jgi:hypothetical protein
MNCDVGEIGRKLLTEIRRRPDVLLAYKDETIKDIVAEIKQLTAQIHRLVKRRAELTKMAEECMDETEQKVLYLSLFLSIYFSLSLSFSHFHLSSSSTKVKITSK